MAWTPKTQNTMGYFTEAVTAPASATTEYSTVIDKIKPRNDGSNQYVSFTVKASAVTGTNFDIAIYGAMTSGGTKFLLKDALVADVTDTTKAVGTININAYPAPYYYLAHTSDVDESANTITYEFFGDLNSDAI